jgi:hypothetical protein
MANALQLRTVSLAGVSEDNPPLTTQGPQKGKEK